LTLNQSYELRFLEYYWYISVSETCYRIGRFPGIMYLFVVQPIVLKITGPGAMILVQQVYSGLL
jgi:hypothetical protein